jgi:AraC-like DNA-binding protein
MKARAPVTRPDRTFYSSLSAFGRFGMRWFTPQIMAEPHSHGHVEFNWLTRDSLAYLFDGQRVDAPSGRLVAFWAGVSHQAIGVPAATSGDIRQCNIYLPLDTFLYLPKLGRLTDTIMGGGVIMLSDDAAGEDLLRRWYRDYRSGDADRTDLLKAEIGHMLRRASLVGWETLLDPWIVAGDESARRATPLRHIVAMVRHMVEHASEPLNVAAIAEVVGLHPNYAQTLFKRVMQISMHRFLLRMRLIRARELLFTSELSIENIAFASGFASSSQFYFQFSRAYGLPPHRLKREYL